MDHLEPSGIRRRSQPMLLVLIAVALAFAGCGGANVSPQDPGDAGSQSELTATSEPGSATGAENGTENGTESGTENTPTENTPTESEPPEAEPDADTDDGAGVEPESETGSDPVPEPAPVAEPISPDCIPGDVEGYPIGESDRRHEDIIFYLTGERQTGDLDPVEETIDDPNFGGVWGDRAGGIVVAVLDCSVVDADEIARIAGGPQYLHLIEVSHTFREIEAFVQVLADELRSLGVQASLPIDSTLTGRHITVQLPDPSVLPDDFGSGVPDHLFSIAEGGLFVEQ